MDNDEQRDHAEEMDNAMTGFRENAKQVFRMAPGGPTNWKPQHVLDYAQGFPNRCTIEEQNGSILIATDLIQAPDGSLWRVTEDEV